MSGEGRHELWWTSPALKLFVESRTWRHLCCQLVRHFSGLPAGLQRMLSPSRLS